MTPVRVAIVGSRNIPQAERFVRRYVMRLPGHAIVVSGGASGVDTWAVDEAKKRKLPYKEFLVNKVGLPPYGAKGSKAAFAARAYARNQEIVDYSDILVAFWDGKSRGTHDTITRAVAAQMPYAYFTPAGDQQFQYHSQEDPKNLYIIPLDGH